MRPLALRVGFAPASLALLAAFLLLCTSSPARALCRPESLLVTRASIPTAYLPHNVVVADFNGDGIPDLATATSHWNPPDQDAVAVLLGAGDGTFRDPLFYPVGRDPVEVVAADFNLDHILDLAVLSRGAGTVSILRGFGDGSFALINTLDAGSDAIEMVTGDFKREGFPDLAVLHSLTGIRVFAGAGDGTFTVTQDLPVSGTATGNLIAGDFNHDGVLDLVFARTGPSIAVAFGHGTVGWGNGTFGAPVTYTGAGAFDVADMNHDGLPDLVMGGGGYISIALGVISGGFAAPVAISPGYQADAVRVADMDGDGSPDIIAGNGTDLYVFSGLGPGDSYRSFANPAPLAAGFITRSLAAFDLDSDGHPDVVAGRYDPVTNAAHLEVLLGHCALGDAPLLDTVTDQPRDQGGHVRLAWRPSGLDGLAGSTVTRYSIFARDPGSDAWRVAGSVTARKANLYGFTATTTQDSTAAGNPLTSFYVSALTADPSVHYDSAVRSGYSTDDLAPGATQGLAASIQPGRAVQLSWSSVAAPDIRDYRIHRVPVTVLPAAPPDGGNLLATATDTTFLDRGAGASSDVVDYWVRAEDVHGNVGPYAQLQLFTTPCQRGTNLVMNNPAGLLLAPSSAIPEPAGGWRHPPALKPRDPPPPYLISYGASLDTMIADASGSGRVSYQLSTGKIHVDAGSPTLQKSLEVATTDVYEVLGPPAGSALTLAVTLELHVERRDLCASPPCAGGAAQVGMLSGASLVTVTLDLAAWGGAPHDTSLTLALPVTAGNAFMLDVDVRAAGAPAGGVAVDGQLHFPGLGAGAVVTSCGGYNSDAVVPVALALYLASATPWAVDLRWFTADRSATAATLYRSQGSGWAVLTTITADAQGYLRYVDRAVVPGRRYGYHLGVLDGGTEKIFGETWVEVPAAPHLGLGPLVAAPGARALGVSFTLESSRPAVLELFDLAGRSLLRREVGTFGPGAHRIEVPTAGLPAGLVFVSLGQEGRVVTRRATLVR